MHVARKRMTSKPRAGLMLASLLTLTLSGCGGDDPTDIQDTIDDLVGTWNITSLMYTPAAGGASVEGVQAGTSGTITFRQDLSYTLTFQETGPPPVTDMEDGTFSVAGDVLTIVPDDAPLDPSDLEIQSLTSTTARLFQADDEYDFDDDGFDEPATTTVVLQKP